MLSGFNCNYMFTRSSSEKDDIIKIRNILLFGIILDICLVVFGNWLVPTALKASSNGLSGLIAILAILVIYAGITIFCLKPTERFNDRILKNAVWFGGLAGAVFLLEIITEYIILPGNDLNSKMGLTEFALAFLIYIAAGFWSACRTQKYFSSLLTSFWTAIIASVIWLGVVLLVFYLFHGTERQQLVLEAEGNLEDFKRSGMTDYNAFVMQDFWGAGFFHLLLGPFLAIIFGSAGGLLGLLGSKMLRLKADK
jgi:hypothetical protein